MLQQSIARDVLIISLKSWRYLAILSGTAICIGLVLFVSLMSEVGWFSLNLILGLVASFYCWRLWLDTRLLTILYQCLEHPEYFDQALKQFWQRTPLPLVPLELAQRWQGCQRLFKWGAVTVVLQWVTLLATFWLV